MQCTTWTRTPWKDPSHSIHIQLIPTRSIIHLECKPFPILAQLDGRELVKVTARYDLQPSKRPLPPTHRPPRRLENVEEFAVQHTHLIDDKHHRLTPSRTGNAALEHLVDDRLRAALRKAHTGPAVDRYTAHVGRGDARGGGHGDLAPVADFVVALPRAQSLDHKPAEEGGGGGGGGEKVGES